MSIQTTIDAIKALPDGFIKEVMTGHRDGNITYHSVKPAIKMVDLKALVALLERRERQLNDLERCEAYVRERYAEGHQAKKDRVKLRRQPEAFESLEAGKEE